jgi:hypothetical protein
MRDTCELSWSVPLTKKRPAMSHSPSLAPKSNREETPS